MENGQKTVLTLFNGDKHFIIPKYQRAYAWEEKQLKDFIEDVKNQRVDKDYFIGTILFQDDGIKEGFEQIQVVDGQQRLTTAVIFLKALFKILNNRDKDADYSREIRRYLKDENYYKLELIQMDNDFFKTHIIEDNPIEEKFIETPSQKRLFKAKKYFEKELKDLSLPELKELKDKVERTKLLTYSVTDTAEATLIFETTNDRGKSLTNLEKTKSFLMHKIYLTKEKPEELLSSIHDRFSAIYRILEEIEYNIDEDSILQYHFISHFDWKYTQKNKDYQQYVQKFKDKINTMLKSEKENDVPEFINNYSAKLKETFNVIKQILSDKESAVRDLFILDRMSLFYPLLVICYKHDSTEDKKEFYDIVRLLEIFSFRVYGIGRKPSYTGRDWLYSLARDFKGDFTELKIQLRDKIVEYMNEKMFKDNLQSPHFYEDVGNLDLRYLFWKYENHLRNNEQPVAAAMSEREFVIQNPRYKLTIEHIASQNPKVCESEILPEIDEDFKENFLHSIGNLTFDPNSANASKSNNEIEIKNTKYFVRAPFKTQNELNDFLDNEKWTRISISTRAKKIIGFTLDYWNPFKIIEGKSNIQSTLEDDDNVSESKEIVKDIVDNLTAEMKKQYGDWSKSFQNKPEHDFKTYQSRDGFETATHIRWRLDKGFDFWIGIEENGGDTSFELYFLLRSRKKSEIISHKFSDPELKKLLMLSNFRDESGTSDKPYFIKTIPLSNIEKGTILELALKEFKKIKQIIERILVK